MTVNPHNPASHPTRWLEWERLNGPPEPYDDHVRLRRDWINTGDHNREYLAHQREKAKLRKARRAAWTAGVSNIMAEARRREAERAIPEPPYFTSDNPLDGERLWG